MEFLSAQFATTLVLLVQEVLRKIVLPATQPNSEQVLQTEFVTAQQITFRIPLVKNALAVILVVPNALEHLEHSVQNVMQHNYEPYKITNAFVHQDISKIFLEIAKSVTTNVLRVKVTVGCAHHVIQSITGLLIQATQTPALAN